ncbi:MAG: c-type cytochrome [Nitriliruptorales bacterium]|nr:c-type cytochrome [Nitriliruptorales bacterium]
MHQLLLLATEAGDDAATGMSGATIAVIILLAALGAFAVAYFVVGPGRRRGPRLKGDIPLAQRPYHSDDELESTGLERAMSWATALAAFSAIFLPLYWLVEPSRIDNKLDDFYERDVELGRVEYAANCTTCHGPNAEGGFASHPDPEIDAPWPAPPLNNIVARYSDTELLTVLGATEAEQVRNFMIDTIKKGRPGTPMPAWGSAHQGPMNDFQIEAIVRYLLSIQTGEVSQDVQALSDLSGEEAFDNNCARCHGFDAEGRVGPSLLNVFERYGGGEDGRAAVRQTIVDGRLVPSVGLMPPFGEELSPEAIDKIVDYLESIQQTGGPSYGQLGGSGEDDS